MRSPCTLAAGKSCAVSGKGLFDLPYRSPRIPQVPRGEGDDEPTMERESVSAVGITVLLFASEVVFAVVLDDDFRLFVDQVTPSDEFPRVRSHHELRRRCRKARLGEDDAHHAFAGRLGPHV